MIGVYKIKPDDVREAICQDDASSMLRRLREIAGLDDASSLDDLAWSSAGPVER